MPTPSIAEFWQLAEASGLVLPEQVASLKSEFEGLRGAAVRGNARTLGEWLIDHRALSRYQCDVLLLGQPGPFQYGDYMVTDRLARGRLNHLFRAIHLPTRQPALLKFLTGPAVLDAGKMNSVRATTAAWSQFDDQRLATCCELLEVGAFKFFVLPELRGQSAAEWLRAAGRMPPAQACTLARDAALGLAALHRDGRAHGDIRPENVWCQVSGGAQLLGFPLARDPLAPPAGLDEWTVDYAAPELADAAARPTPLTDVYALGCTLYEMLTGRPPFDGGAGYHSIADKMVRHATEPIAPLDQSGPMPEGLGRVVSFMMAKNYSIRFAQASVVVDALAPFIEVNPKAAEADAAAARGAKALRAYCKQRPVAETAPTAATERVPGATPQMPVVPTIEALPQAPVVQPTAVAQPATVVQKTGALPQAPAPAPTPTVAPTVAIPSPTDLRLPSTFQPGAFTPAFGGEVPAAKPGAKGVAPPAGNTAVMRNFGVPKADTRGQEKASRQKIMLIAIGSLIGLFLLGFFILSRLQGTKASGDKTNGDKPATAAVDTDHTGDTTPKTGDAPDSKEPDAKDPADSRPRPAAVADDGSSMWASPTQGPAPQIRYVAPGAQVLFVLRPQSLLSSARGQKTLDAMGPSGAALLAWIEAQTGQKAAAIDRLDIALYEAFGERPTVSLVAYLKNRPTTAALVAAWGNPSPVDLNGQTFYQQDNLCRYLPPPDKNKKAMDEQVVVVAQRTQLDDILSRGSEPAPLDANLQALVDSADAQRHINIFFLPVYLRAARDTLYPGVLAPVRDAIDWFLGSPDEALAGAASMELSDPFFAELRLFPARNKKPSVVARDLKQRLDDWSARVQSHLFTLAISPYSREVLRDLPFMLESVATNTRQGTDGRVAMVRWYLPGPAAANLALATDLLLLETAGTAPVVGATGGTSGSGSTGAAAPKTVWDKLKQPVTVSFERDSLENALKLLSTEMGVKIEIVGNDLKLDGITKNQPLGLDLRGRPAEEVLNQIMLLANPDRTVKKLSDPVQKLAYVVLPQYKGGEDTILITTRAKAAEHGKLPAVFGK